MDLPTYFRDFLIAIRPTAEQQRDAKEAHTRLRTLLLRDQELDNYIITTLLQGSYQRSTDVKPIGDKKSDVDVLVITNMDKAQFPEGASALEEFRPFLDANYDTAYEEQGHSWGIIDGEVELDLVPTSAPSEAVQHELRKLRESGAGIDLGLDAYRNIRKQLSDIREALAKSDAWKVQPLEIPDRERLKWERTHPLAQIEWTEIKNARCNNLFVDVVRATKWWWLCSGAGRRPSGYLLEALVAACCPDGITSIAAGFVSTLEAIVGAYRVDVANGRIPFIPDHGLPENNVLERLKPAEFAAFYAAVQAVAPTARRALESDNRADSIALWGGIFGEDFPTDGGDGGNGGGQDPAFPTPRAPAVIGKERFA